MSSKSVFIYSEYPQLRFWIEWSMQTLQKWSYLVWGSGAFWCQIIFSQKKLNFNWRWHGCYFTQICYATFNRWNGKRNVNVNQNDDDWNDDWWFSVRRNSLHFSLASAREFCFVSCPYQPPSIRPTSSSFSAKARNFLVSSDLVSKSTKSSTFKVSTFRIARRT